MARQTHIRDCDERLAHSPAHATVCRCQKAIQAWKQATDTAEQSQLHEDCRAALEALFELLEADLDTLVRQWASLCVPPAPLADERYLLVAQEVVGHLVLNIFTAIVQPLPRQTLDAKTDVRGALLALAERSLYNRY